MSAQKEELPGVSVIIPVYNREQFLAECIQSVLDQRTDFPVEIVCADDGSTDRSKEIALSLGDSIVWLDKPRDCKEQGCGTTRNRGIERATYPILSFLDSDDVFMPEHLSRCYDYLKLNPDKKIVIDKLYGMNNQGKWIRDYRDVESVKHKSYFLDVYFQFNVVLLRREIFSSVGGMFCQEDILSEDYDFLLRVLENGFQIPILEGGGACLREHNERSTRVARVMYSSAEKTMYKAIKRWRYPASWIRKRKAVFQFHYAQSDISDKKYISALFRLFYAALLDPVRAVKTVLHIK